MCGGTTPTQFGRRVWYTMHAFAEALPRTEPAPPAAHRFYESVGELLPCGACAEHFRQELRAHYPRTATGQEVAAWVHAAHNRVNERLGRAPYPYRKVVARFRRCQGEPRARRGGEGLGVGLAAGIALMLAMGFVAASIQSQWKEGAGEG
jgi:hypothetical protein